MGALVLGVGCGGATSAESAPGSVTGTVGGNAITTTSVIGVNQTGTGGFAVAVVFVNVADACSVVQSNHRPGNLAELELNVQAAGEPTTGTYTITPGGGVPVGPIDEEGGAPTTSGSNSPFVTAAFEQTNASCTTTESDNASSGSVTLTTVSPSEVAGRFDVMFPSGDHLTGTFDAPVCTVPSGPTTPTCGG
jgi:hypothetical protein